MRTALQISLHVVMLYRKQTGLGENDLAADGHRRPCFGDEVPRQRAGGQGVVRCHGVRRPGAPPVRVGARWMIRIKGTHHLKIHGQPYFISVDGASGKVHTAVTRWRPARSLGGPPRSARPPERSAPASSGGAPGWPLPEPEIHRGDLESGPTLRLLGIFSQTAGSACKFRVNPVNFTFGSAVASREATSTWQGRCDQGAGIVDMIVWARLIGSRYTFTAIGRPFRIRRVFQPSL